VTIEKGRPWGEPWTGPEYLPTVDGDADLARLAHEAHLAGEVLVATPRSGDLLRTLGLDAPRDPGRRHRYPVDLAVAHLRARTGGEAVTVAFVAHLTVRDRPLTGFGPGLSVAVMNAAWFDDLRLGPRAHPNDGLLDVTEGTVGPGQRREANRRARTGSHLPHPGLRTARTATWEGAYRRPVPVWTDGVRRGRYSSIRVDVVPDAFAVVA